MPQLPAGGRPWPADPRRPGVFAGGARCGPFRRGRFVIEAGEMNHAVENQDAHFHRERAREAASIAARSFGRDGDIADVFRAWRRTRTVCRKGEHVGWAHVFPVRFVEAGHVCVADQLDGHGFGSEAKFMADALMELPQRRNGHGYAALAVDDHCSRNNLFGGLPTQNCRQTRYFVILAILSFRGVPFAEESLFFCAKATERFLGERHASE